MKMSFRLFLCTCMAMSFGCSVQSTSRHLSVSSHESPQGVPAQIPLLLVSIDGYRADYAQRGLSPELVKLARTGVWAISMQPSFPSMTFPNHYTLVTGLRPDHHGMVSNTMIDPALGQFSPNGAHNIVDDGRWWSEGTPLWETVSQHGFKSATMFWPGSGADIHGKHPDIWLPFDSKITGEQRVDQVLAWLDLPVGERPAFITLYLNDVDDAGHTYGPDSLQMDLALRKVDAVIGRLVEGLRQRRLFDQINLIILSDHGMASVPAGNTIFLDGLIPIQEVEVVGLGVLVGLNPVPGHDFRQIEARLEGKQEHMGCWDKTRIPPRFAYGGNPRIPQMICLADVGWRIDTVKNGSRANEKVKLGEHGYDNGAVEMQALFIARGPSFLRGATVPSFSNVDVYPLMAHLLGVQAAANDGNYEHLRGILTPDAR